MQNYQSITLDVNNCVEYKYINAKQGDIDSRFLKITLTENGEKIVPTSKCTASFRCLKPDGRICVNKSTINSDGTITASLTEQVLASAGTVRADISLLDGSSVLSSATFFITVEVSPATEGNVLSSDEFLILVETTNEAVEAINTIHDVVDNVLNEIGEVKSFIGYTDKDILGLCVDYENKKFTRLAGAVGKNAGDDFDEFPMYGGMRRCNVDDDGTITAYYGDADYKEDGSNGQVMVYMPKFYYKVVPLKLEPIENSTGYHICKANYYISATPKTGFKIHPAFINEQNEEVDYFLYSAYEGSLYLSEEDKYYNDADYKQYTVTSSDKICSVADQKPVSGQSISANNGTGVNLIEALAENRGAGWHCQTFKSLSALQFLMMIEYATLNLQAGLAKGICKIGKDYTINYCANTGATSSLGNKSGSAASSTYQYYDKTTNKTVTENQTAIDRVAVSYRGIENPYGNIFKWVAGINGWGNGSMNGGQAYICDDFNFAVNKNDDNYTPIGFYLPTEQTYISAFGYGNKKYDWAFIPSEAKGTSALPVGDKTYSNPDVNKYTGVVCSGAWDTDAGAGMFLLNFLITATKGIANTGCRMIYLPQNECKEMMV